MRRWPASRPHGDDLIAGAITAALLVPQAMAYAQLAGLPPQYGLYAAIFPPLIYALLASSRDLAVGPVAITALMVASALGDFAAGQPGRWIEGTIILSAEVGLTLLLLRALRLGSLVNFISHPVLLGFTAGAALLIILSQAGLLLGLALPRGAPVDVAAALLARLPDIDPATAALSALTVVLLLAARKPLVALLHRLGLPRRHALLASRAAPLAILALAIVASLQLGPAVAGSWERVGSFPAGLPLPSLSWLQTRGWLQLAPSALLIALVSYVESIAIAKRLAARRRERLDPDRELLALGAGNLMAAVVGTLTVAGSFSRSMVNVTAGARSQWSSVFASALVAAIALWFAGWLAPLPQAVLAAIIVVSVAPLIDLRGAWSVYRYDHADGATLLVTFSGVLTLGIEAGLVLGILLALALYLRRSSHPHLAVLGRIPGTEHFRNVDRHQVECTPGLMVLRIDENLFFANVDAVEDGLDVALRRNPQTRHVVLVLSAVSYIDSSALDALDRLERTLAERGIELHLAEVKGPVMDRLARTVLGRRLQERTHLSTHLAVRRLSQLESTA